VTFRLISTSSRAVPGMPLGITPDHWYFGREVAVSNRHIIAPFLLPKRVYIGPTSMDTEMAFVMCSMAKVISPPSPSPPPPFPLHLLPIGKTPVDTAVPSLGGAWQACKTTCSPRQ